MSGWIPTLRGGAAVAAALALIACETPLDRAFGKAVHENVAAATANPDAGKQSLDAPRPDGTSADTAVDKFRTEEHKVDKGEDKSIINVNVGH